MTGHTTYNYPTLYKLDSKGKVREWTILYYCMDGVWRYKQVHGLKGGKLQETFTYVREGKNIGKANETTPEQQCKLEAESLWKKQRDRKGYTEDIPSAVPPRPMLAQKYSEHGHKIEFPCFAQPKLDGYRCWASLINGEVQLQSRTGMIWYSLPHLQEALKPFFDKHPDVILDGELYNHEFKEDFQKLSGAIKRDAPIAESRLVQLHVYDMVDPDVPYKQRSKFINLNVVENDFVKLVVSTPIGSREVIEQVVAEYLEEGYEGGMLRNGMGLYKINGRSYDLQKYKLFEDDEFEIIGAEENKGKQAGECVLICRTKHGGVFSVKPKGSSEVRRQYWEDFKAGKLTGKMLTVRYFRMTTSNPPVPYLPVGIVIRSEYE